MSANVCSQIALALRSKRTHSADMSYVDRIVDRFGGVRPMARAIGKPVSTVWSWQSRRSIPDQHKAEILGAANLQGLALGPEDFFPKEKGAA